LVLLVEVLKLKATEESSSKIIEGKMNIEKIRELFPITKEKIYLNHASTGPLTTRARKAMDALLDIYEFEGDITKDMLDTAEEQARTLSAKLLGAEKSEIAIVKNTSQGLILPMNALDWDLSSNVILAKGGFPANIYPWLYNLPDVEKRFVELRKDEDFYGKCVSVADKKTKAIAVDWVDFLTGKRVDLERLGEFCQHRDILLFVDGIQGLGAIRIDISKIKVDFFSAGASKWLFGPQGVGIMYISKRVFNRLKSNNTGWLSAQWKNFNDFSKLPPLKNSASRFEEGTRNLIGIYGFIEHLKLFLEVGMEEIEKRIFLLTDMLIDGIRKKGCEIASPVIKEERAGIVTFKPVRISSEELHKNLVEKNIIVSIRSGFIRVSPHFYNTEKEIEQFLKYV